MGIIEDSIYKNYKKSLQEGNIDQAKLAVELASALREKIERLGFIDFSVKSDPAPINIGSFFNPFPYRYYPKQAVVVLNQSAINLTKTENKLFSIFSDNESHGVEIKIVSRQTIRQLLWPTKQITACLIRVTVRRLRLKIELDSSKPQMIINFYDKGYIFLGKRIADPEE